MMLPRYRIIEFVPAAAPASSRGDDSIAAALLGPMLSPSPSPSNASVVARNQYGESACMPIRERCDARQHAKAARKRRLPAPPLNPRPGRLSAPGPPQALIPPQE